jgi:hypothetical protein
MTRPVRAARSRSRTRPVAAAHRSRPLSVLRSTKHDKVFTYDIGATRGTRLAHLGLTVGDDGG